MTVLSFAERAFSPIPFPHLRVPQILAPAASAAVLDWLSCRAPWKLRVEDFYEQHEFSLLSSDLGEQVKPLVAHDTVNLVREELRNAFGITNGLALVDINAHRLTPGQTIRIHNDFIKGEETHRLLVQLNSGWTEHNGGLLMLFRGPEPESVANIVLPRNGSGFAFEISPRSYHAVSRIVEGERYTLVYSFKASA